MQLLITTLPTFAVAAIYCVWRRVYEAQVRREQTLRERVTRMLWVIATEVA
jgi:hypothetical protein